MISIEQVICELRLINAQISERIVDCKRVQDRATTVMSGLDAFVEDGLGVYFDLSGAADSLYKAQGALMQLRDDINNTILQISK